MTDEPKKVIDAAYRPIDPRTGQPIPRWQVWRTHKLVLVQDWPVIVLMSGALALISVLRGG